MDGWIDRYVVYMHICTIEMPQTSWYHINICISNTKSKPENIHYPLQPYQKSPPLQSWIQKHEAWHYHMHKNMQITSLRSPINAQTEVKADWKIDIHGLFQQKKQPSKIQVLELNGIDIMLTSKKATSVSAKDFFKYISSSFGFSSFRTFQSANFETPKSTYNCENMFPGMWCPENPIPKKKTPPPPQKKGLLESLASQSHSRKLFQSHKHPFAAPKNARTTANQFLSESFQAISWAFFVCFYSVQCGPLLVIISRIITQVTHL